MSTEIKQTVIPKKVIKMAKAIIEADKKKQQIFIVQKRNSGKSEAFRLARNNN